MKLGFNGRVALVTGGARGIGFTCARMLLEAGAKVALVDLHTDALREAEEVLSGLGIVKSYAVDVSNVDSLADAVEHIRCDMGEVEVLIQAAALQRGKTALDITPQDWDAMMSVNARALFFMMQEVVRQSMSKTGGTIVNFAATAGIRGLAPPRCAAHYSASKGAVVSLTQQAAVEWAHLGVRVNAVAPGGILTGIMAEITPPEDVLAPVPLKRLASPEDVANCVCFLASDLASMVTGQVLAVDGGSCAVGY